MAKENFYEQTYIDVSKLLDQQKYLEADEILSKELSMPYIPLEFEKKFVELKALVDTKLNKDNPAKGNLKSLEDIIYFFEYEDMGNIEMVSSNINMLGELNLQKKEKEMKFLFSLKEVPKWVKTEIFFILSEQKINRIFLLNGLKVNPVDYESLNSIEEVQNFTKSIRSFEYDENVINLAIELFLFFFKNVFPEKIDYSKLKMFSLVFIVFSTEIIKGEDISEMVINENNFDKEDFNKILEIINGSTDSFNL